MKHFILQVFSILVISQAPAQVHHTEYFFDADPGFGNGHSLPFLNPAADSTFTFNVGIGSLTKGIHTLFFRSYDSAKATWSFSIPKMFYKETVQSHTRPNIVKAEYFIDTDPGFGNGNNVGVTAGEDITFTFNRSIAGLSTGIHRLFVRTRDANGKWSHTTSQMFYYEKAQSHSIPNIIKAEYFIDTDPGFGNGNNVGVTAGEDITFTFNRSIAGLSTGIHRFYMRTRDANGKWSHTTSQMFYYEKAQSHSIPNIVKAEYFIDTDPGFGNGNNVGVTAGEDITFTFNRSIAGLSTGIHRFYMRTRDANGKWSLTTSQMFYYEPVLSHSLPNIVRAEYFIDTDPGFGNGNNIPVDTSEAITFTFDADINSLATGLHRLVVRSQDAEGKWSISTTQLFYRESVQTHHPGNLVRLEWFWDTDPGFGNAHTVTLPAGQTEITNFAFNVDVSGFSNQIHNLFVRVLDDWSLTTVVKVDFTNIVLPVTLLSFNARAENESVKTSWEVTAELNMNKYIVEHSMDAVHFTAIGERNAVANNGGEAGYSFYHNNPAEGINYYRLKQVELDGGFSYSQVVAVNFSKGSVMVSVYPNPATSVFQVNSKDNISEVSLVDISGKIIRTYPNGNAYSLDGIPSGAYLVRIVLKKDGVVTRPIIVAR